ncbi:MAG: glycosyltransferase family 4 protein [Thermodesulfobacteriota bacterium]
MSERVTILNVRAAMGGGGGADTVLMDFAHLIDKNKFRVIVLYLRKPDKDIEPIKKRLEKLGIEFLELPGSILDRKMLKKMRNIIEEQKVDIYHSHDYKSDSYGYLLSFFCPAVKFVSTCHGWIYRSGKSAIYNRIDKSVLKRFDQVLAVSSEILEKARSHGIKPVRLMLNSIDTEKWSLGENDSSGSEGTTTVGYVGRISPEKGPLDFVRTAKAVLGTDKGFEFTVAGDGQSRVEMEELVKELALEGNFKFLGHIGEEELMRLYETLDILLLPSYSEGVPITVLEAGATGVPVVATEVGGVGEVITNNENGILVSSGDTGEMAAGVLKIKNDQAYREKLIKRGREVIEDNFSIHKNVKVLEDIYLNIIKV